jgi:hypothetical protein
VQGPRVLSLPYRVRFVCAHDPAALATVRRILVRAIAGYYERSAARLGKPRPRAGAVAFVAHRIDHRPDLLPELDHDGLEAFPDDTSPIRLCRTAIPR